VKTMKLSARLLRGSIFLGGAICSVVVADTIGDQHFLTVFIVGIGVSFSASVAVTRGSPEQRDTVFGSATWATNRLLRKLGLLNGAGVFLGQTDSGHYLRHHGPEHYAVIAPTRSGKGAGVVVPTLLSWMESVVIYDLKEENWNISARFRSNFSHVIYFNPNSINSAHYNPLLEVRRGPMEVRDVQNAADMIVDPDGTGYSDHWIKTGHSLLVGAILHILYAGKPEEKNLPGIVKFLSNPQQTLVETLREMLTYPHLEGEGGERSPHPVVAGAARDMLNKSENERSGVLSTAMSFLTLYRDPIVAKNICDSDFRILDLVDSDRPVTLYIIVPPSDIDRLKPLVRLIINQICRRLTEEHKPRKRKHRLLLLLDEFPALGRLHFFETSLGFIAGYGIKAMLVCQSINQLRKIYGERNSLLDNTQVRVFYAPNTIETAEYISRSLGQATETYQTSSEGGKKGAFWLSSENIATHLTGRPLLTPGEVMELPPEDAIVFIGGTQPIRCKKIRYYEDFNFIPLVGQPPEIPLERPYPFGPPLTEDDWTSSPSVDDALNAHRRIVITPIDEEGPLPNPEATFSEGQIALGLEPI
jgi:type IV secretion system protein VirD4